MQILLHFTTLQGSSKAKKEDMSFASQVSEYFEQEKEEGIPNYMMRFCIESSHSQQPL